MYERSKRLLRINVCWAETSILKREYSDEARTDNNTTTQKATYAEMMKNGKKKQPNFELKHFKKKL